MSAKLRGGNASHLTLNHTGFDHGAADLMASGRIRVKQGAEPTEYSSTGLIMSDGSTLTADVVIFA